MNLKFNKVTIVGVGLIGGSLALAIKKNKIAKEVGGLFRSRKSLQRALRNNIVDRGYLNFKEAFCNTEFVILALPVYKIVRIGKMIKDEIKRDILITDVGSTKLNIVQELSKVYPHYIGSHPLAGSEKKGCLFSNAALFEKKVTVLTPTSNSKEKDIALLKKFWKKLGSSVVLMAPAQHDKLVSHISHLPHLVIFSLLNLVAEGELKYASSGFRDSTRIATSESENWTEIFLSNRKYLLKDIDSFIKKLKQYKKYIQEDKYQKVLYLLASAKEKRRQLQ